MSGGGCNNILQCSFYILQSDLVLEWRWYMTHYSERGKDSATQRIYILTLYVNILFGRKS